ncbi:MAG: 50S ribosomal protein L28 [bacterium]|nr:50S ribosomal protein L28 [bacterium]
MARKCSLTGVGPMSGNRVSHSHRKTRMRQLPNLQTKRIYVPELGRTIRVKLSTRALRTVTKKGFVKFLHDQGLRLKDVVR